MDAEPTIAIHFDTGHTKVKLELPQSHVSMARDPQGNPTSMVLNCTYWPGNVAEPLEQMLLAVAEDLVGKHADGHNHSVSRQAFLGKVLEATLVAIRAQVEARWAILHPFTRG